MTKNTETPDYDHLYDILAKRMSIRRLKPDPIPDDYVHKILEAGRWAMSGANSQPWEFVVVKDETGQARIVRGLSRRQFRLHFLDGADARKAAAPSGLSGRGRQSQGAMGARQVRHDARLVGGAGAHRHPGRWPAAMGNGAGRAHFRPPPESSHRRARQCGDADASRGCITGAWARSTSRSTSRSRSSACWACPIW